MDRHVLRGSRFGDKLMNENFFSQIWRNELKEKNELSSALIGFGKYLV